MKRSREGDYIVCVGLLTPSLHRGDTFNHKERERERLTLLEVIERRLMVKTHIHTVNKLPSA
jgi:hypothetical protein